MPYSETDFLGRKIDKLFITAPIALSNQKLFTCGQIYEIAPTSKTCVTWVAVALSAGADAGTSQMGFGTTLAGTDWSGAAINVSLFTDSPKVYYQENSASVRTGPIANGTGFYMTIGNAFNAGATAVITVYGFTY